MLRKEKWANLIRLEYGKPIRQYDGGNTPVYGTNGQIGYCNLSPMCSIPSFILGRKGAYRGIHYSSVPFSVIDTAYYAVPINLDVIDMKWAYYKFLTYDINSMDSGSAIPSTDRNQIYAIEVELPSIEEQRTVASILSSLDDKIELNNCINITLEEMAQAIFRRWFVDFEFPDENGNPYKSSGGEMVESEMRLIPKGWRVGAFTEIVDVLGGGTPKTDTAGYWAGDIPFFTPKDCSSSYYVLDTEKHITASGLATCNSKLYPENTVFITARGTVGKVALAGCKMAMNQSCYALWGKPGYNQLFVHQLTLIVIDILKNHANGAVFDAIVTRDFDTASVIIPEPIVADKFGRAVAAIYKRVLLSSNEGKELQVTRDTLLPRLISGIYKSK